VGSQKKVAPKGRSTTPIGSSYANATPLGVVLKTRIERGDAYSAPEIYDLDITLLEIIRGSKAFEKAKAEGVCSAPPKSGFEYLLACIRFGYSRRGRGLGYEPYKLTEGQFAVTSADGKKEYEVFAVAKQPEPHLIGVVFSSGETREGWILLQVPKKEKKPLLIYKRENYEGIYGIWKGVWFQLY
jgi:hypothetical protein